MSLIQAEKISLVQSEKITSPPKARSHAVDDVINKDILYYKKKVFFKKFLLKNLKGDAELVRISYDK